MKRVPLAAIFAAVSLVACKETFTAPSSSADPSVRYYGENPPPPDVDTQAVGSNGSGTFAFTLNVRYFFNKPANSGWLKFDSEQGDATVDKNAQIRYSGGVFSGKGTVTSQSGVVLDLTQVRQTSRFSSCAPWTTIGTSGAATTSETAPIGCFNLVIGGVDGDVYLTEKCTSNPDAGDPRDVCKLRQGT